MHKTIRKWAPLMKLAKNERWRPSSVEFFLHGTKLEGGNGPIILTPYTLPKCSKNCFLTTRDRMRSSTTDDLPLFYGQPLHQVPVYAFVDMNNKEVKIRYLMFYPYNHGKTVCIGINLRNACLCGKLFFHCLCPRFTGCFGVKKFCANKIGS